MPNFAPGAYRMGATTLALRLGVSVRSSPMAQLVPAHVAGARYRSWPPCDGAGPQVRYPNRRTGAACPGRTAGQDVGLRPRRDYGWG